MATLNMRERRIEAKIVYLGPALAGKATNFRRLLETPSDARIGSVEPVVADPERLLALSFRPREASPFRDCSMRVEVVAPRGKMVDSTVREILRDVDGVVLVMDAQPAALEQNRESLELLRGVLAEDARELPVVVQLNKSDVPDALAPSALALDGYPAVRASATRGEGVHETLETALEAVLASMTREDPQPNGEMQATGREDDGPPLLGALRRVLRDTVREHREEEASRTLAALAPALERIERRLDALESRAESAAAAEPTRVSSTDMAVSMRLELLSENLHELGKSLGRVATKSDLGDVVASTDSALVGQSIELGAVIEATSRVERDHVTASTASVTRALEVLAAQIAEGETRAHLVEITALLQRADASRASLERRLDSMQTHVDEIVEALKKSKRWFT